MVPTAFDGENLVLDKPPTMSADECGAISMRRDVTPSGMPIMISCWKITKEELEILAKTGRIWLTICGNLVPPVRLTVERPFVLEDKSPTE